MWRLVFCCFCTCEFRNFRWSWTSWRRSAGTPRCCCSQQWLRRPGSGSWWWCNMPTGRSMTPAWRLGSGSICFPVEAHRRQHRGNVQAEEVRYIGRPRSQWFPMVSSAASGGALHRQVNNEFSGDRESPLCFSPAGCEAPTQRPESGAGRARPVGLGESDQDAGQTHCRLQRRPGWFCGAPPAGAAAAHPVGGAEGLGGRCTRRRQGRPCSCSAQRWSTRLRLCCTWWQRRCSTRCCTSRS